jgi:hypothetical protein
MDWVLDDQSLDEMQSTLSDPALETIMDARNGIENRLFYLDFYLS